MTEIWPRVSLDIPPNSMIDLANLFPVPMSDIWLEIGFGSGEHLIEQALRLPNVGFIGCEPFLNGVASLMGSIQRHTLMNIRVVKDDAKLLMGKLPDQSIGRIFVLFPDPWPKKRHYKRRIIQDAVINEFARILKVGGSVYMATDHEEYGSWMQSVMQRNLTFFLDLGARASIHERPQDWPLTRYEQKGISQGRDVVYLVYRLV